MIVFRGSMDKGLQKCTYDQSQESAFGGPMDEGIGGIWIGDLYDLNLMLNIEKMRFNIENN